jgi:hypothetical protein
MNTHTEHPEDTTEGVHIIPAWIDPAEQTGSDDETTPLEPLADWERELLTGHKRGPRTAAERYNPHDTRWKILAPEELGSYWVVQPSRIKGPALINRFGERAHMASYPTIPAAHAAITAAEKTTP